MVALADIKGRRDEIINLARAFGASDVRVFGSVARGDALSGSDLDLLVRFEPGRSLIDLAGLQLSLRDLLQVEVDLVTEAGLRERVRRKVLREAIPL